MSAIDAFLWNNYQYDALHHLLTNKYVRDQDAMADAVSYLIAEMARPGTNESLKDQRLIEIVDSHFKSRHDYYPLN